MNFDHVLQSMQAAGMTPRGAFQPTEHDGVPMFADQIPTRTVVLAGNAGPHMWRAFDAACRAEGVEPTGRLDSWSKRVLNELAQKLNARAVSPFEKPYLPFQAWARRAEPCYPSPVGMLVHPDYGLWHSYRGALLFAEEITLPPRDTRPNPCATCADRPCLTACPVGAYSVNGYDVPRCTRHLAGPPKASCMDIGCLTRHACPVGRNFRYEPAQARFHMEAFFRVLGPKN